MRKIIILFIFILFFLNREIILMSGIEAINMWANTLFPLLFPTFIISDLLLASGIVNIITKLLGGIYAKLFKLNRCGIYIFLISLISGTPTNAKNLKSLRDNNYITDDEVTKILSTCIFFNPLLIIRLTNIKILLIMWTSNIITGIVLNWKNKTPNSKSININYPFNLNKSIENNINILLNILGTITVFLLLANLLPIKSPFFKVIFSGFLEVTTGLNKTNLFFKTSGIYEYLILVILSFGGISIFYQIKSILKDTNLNIKYFFLSRLLCTTIAIFICFLTQIITTFTYTL